MVEVLDSDEEGDADFEVTRVRIQSYAREDLSTAKSTTAKHSSEKSSTRAEVERSSNKICQRISKTDPNGASSSRLTASSKVVTGSESTRRLRRDSTPPQEIEVTDELVQTARKAASKRKPRNVSIKGDPALAKILTIDPTPINTIDVPVPEWLATKALNRLACCVACKVRFKVRQSGPDRWVSIVVVFEPVAST